MANVLERVLRVGEARTLRRLKNYAEAVNLLEEHFEELTDDELRHETVELRERYSSGESLDDLLPEAFAAVREASKRTLGLRHFDVQLMGGAALHLGNIAEMKTGEGKTLVATTAAYLNAIASRGVHVITVNDYLASYQSELMGRVFRALGMTTGCILSGQTPEQRREQYAADITYGTNNEFGFDYLRDNMAWQASDMVQRGHHFAIVDEVDSILIDEARTPLIISGPSSGEANRWFGEFASVANRLQRGRRLRGRREEAHRRRARARHREGRGLPRHRQPLRVGQHPADLVPQQLDQGEGPVQARQGLRRDERRGAHRRRAHRPHPGRPSLQRGHPPGDRGEGGREGQGREPDPRDRHAAELLPPLLEALRHDRYRRDRGRRVHVAPTSSASCRSRPTGRWSARTSPTSSTRARPAKFDQVVEDIVERHRSGQPVLVGTTSVEKSEYLSRLLAKRGVKHEVLNAKNHAREAAIIAQAGRIGAVTVATNMAGRGTDIMLGGNAEFLAVAEMHDQGLEPGRALRTSTRPRGTPCSPPSRRRCRRRPTRSSTPAVSTCSAPSATSRAASTTSCADVPAARATRARAASTSRCRTTSCACSTRAPPRL